MGYDRNKAVEYALKWAFKRNPDYYDFEKIGGDCTNFVSQCLYAGCGIMNYTPVTGWYYISINHRSASWTSVEYLYKFLTMNTGKGLYGEEVPLKYAQLGDVIQLSANGDKYTHTSIVTSIDEDGIKVTTHSIDRMNAALDQFTFQDIRLIHIKGVNY